MLFFSLCFSLSSSSFNKIINLLLLSAFSLKTKIGLLLLHVVYLKIPDCMGKVNLPWNKTILNKQVFFIIAANDVILQFSDESSTKD